MLIIIVILGAILMIYASLDKAPAPESISSELQKWNTSQKRFSYGEYTLSYHDTQDEDKEVMLLLHGYPSSSYDWHLVWDLLSKRYRLISMDMLGFGLSDKPKDIHYSISLQTDIQEALLFELNIKEVHLLAHDYGDNIAQELLARISTDKSKNNLMINSVVLLNGGLFPETYQSTTIQSLLRSPLGPLVSALSNGSVFAKNFSRVFGVETQPSESDLNDHWYLICKNNGNKINYKLTHAVEDRARNRERWLAALQADDVPILFINGLADPVTGIETVEHYMQVVPKPNVIKLDTIGHYPQLEAPQEIIKAVYDFAR